MNSQNKNLVAFFLFIIVTLLIIFFRTGFFSTDIENAEKVDIPQVDSSSINNSVGMQDFSSKIQDCFELKSKLPNNLISEPLLKTLEMEWGAVTVLDRSIQWKIEAKDGKIKLLNLTISYDDKGIPQRELSYYLVEQKGELIPITLESNQPKVASDEIVSSLLKDAQVLNKGREFEASFSKYQASVFIAEENGIIQRFNIATDKKKFSCDKADNPITCQCSLSR